jgi:small subunit ribosomal protein S8
MDPIADMLIRIKNAQAVNKDVTSLGYSDLKWEIARVLERTGFIGEISKKGKRGRKLMEIKLLYVENNSPRVSGARRVSKLSKRVYGSYKEIFPIKNGLGMAVYSTPKGVLSDKEARKEKVGGEVLFEIW